MQDVSVRIVLESVPHRLRILGRTCLFGLFFFLDRSRIFGFDGLLFLCFLSRYSGVAREILEALLDKYMNTGIYEIERTEILKLDPFTKYGKPAKIAQAFGGKEGYLKAIHELEEEIYSDGAMQA